MQPNAPESQHQNLFSSEENDKGKFSKPLCQQFSVKCTMFHILKEFLKTWRAGWTHSAGRILGRRPQVGQTWSTSYRQTDTAQILGQRQSACSLSNSHSPSFSLIACWLNCGPFEGRQHTQIIVEVYFHPQQTHTQAYASRCFWFTPSLHAYVLNGLNYMAPKQCFAGC